MANNTNQDLSNFQWNTPLMPAAERYGFGLVLDEMERQRKIMVEEIESLRKRIVELERWRNS